MDACNIHICVLHHIFHIIGDHKNHGASDQRQKNHDRPYNHICLASNFKTLPVPAEQQYQKKNQVNYNLYPAEEIYFFVLIHLFFHHPAVPFVN